jgi:hypothetical protein
MTVSVSASPARGRFTAAAGTFTGWTVGQVAAVSGSGLGNLTLGGNNHAPGASSQIHAVAPDGSWVELLGPFVAEAPRAFVLARGPLPLFPLFVAQLRAAVDKAVTQLRRVVTPVLFVWANGEGDLGASAQYQVALQRVLDEIRGIFGLRVKGAAPVATVVVGLTRRTPLGSDLDVTTVRAAQEAVVAGLQNAAFVDTDRLQMEMGIGAPRIVRQQNGIHWTPIAQRTLGFLIDQAAGTLAGIPAHPDGDAAVDYGAVGGTAILGGAEALDGGGEESGDSGGIELDGPVGTGGLIVEDGTGYDDAESLCSIEQFDAFWAKQIAPTAVTAATATQKAAALRQATREWVEPNTALLRGHVQYQDQRLGWPRIGCWDDEGRLVKQNTVPKQFVEATALVAAELLAGGTILTNGVERGAVTRETKRGLGFEQTFEYGEGAASASVRRMRAAEALIYPFVRGGDSGVARS